jgi:fumarate hydratase subunit alpha
MREITTTHISKAVRDLAISANIDLGEDVLTVLQSALEREESPTGRDILHHLIENARIARSEGLPMCQDTGLAIVFADIGQEVHISGGSLRDAINDGVRSGYADGYLRASVRDLFTGENTGDNTPAVVHFDVVPGDKLKLCFMAKGGGSENMSRVTALTPADGIDGIRRLVIERVRDAGANPCPPTIVGVGIGGSLELAAILSKKAVLRPLGSPNPDERLAKLEAEWLEDINRLGIGPQGLGGRITSLAVHILVAPHHIASIPVAVNLQCHSCRHKEVVL